ncbi:anti-sigma factor [Microlunatus elymi]|uniref:Regulator of SigK n=1 Tax=Microlunatus elymi TaxID=2596828 RepID=A0A516PUM4_9ACTN|nr:anti-sigma factor [Microlunatus elymi]QDP94895.1 anti-sigma factor [Microlunatus elymi]
MSDPHQLLAAYALDALDADERAQFEAHLETCADCRRDLTDFAPTVAELSAPDATPPPPQLRGHVMAAIGRVRQDAPDATVVRMPARRRRVVQVAAAVIGAAALVAAVALGGWAYGRHQLDREQQDYHAAISRVLGAPDAKIYHQVAPNGMQVTYVVSEKRNGALAVPEDVPGPGRDHTYQLWTVRVSAGAKDFVPDRTFDQADGPIVLTGDVRSAAALGVTVEPDGGSPKPTTDPFAVQTL